MTDRILRPAEIRKKYGGISNTTFYEWVKQGKIPKPKPIVPGGRATGVRESGNRRGHRRAREGRIVPDVATPDAVDWDALDSVQQAYMVEVVGRYPDDPDEWYRVDAGWLREALDGRDIISPRSHLLPLLPPEPEAVTRSTAAV